jgi:hypothetical protein
MSGSGPSHHLLFNSAEFNNLANSAHSYSLFAYILFSDTPVQSLRSSDGHRHRLFSHAFFICFVNNVAELKKAEFRDGPAPLSQWNKLIAILVSDPVHSEQTIPA